MEYNVVLSELCRQWRGDGTESEQYIYLSNYLRTALVSSGVESFSPLEHGAPPSLDPCEAVDTLTAAVVAALDPRRLNIVGFTNFTSRAVSLLHLGQRVKKHAADNGIELMIIGGGPHFAKETLQKNGEYFPDSVENALLKTTEDGVPIYDGIVYGGFRAFIELIELARADQLQRRNGIYAPRGDPPRGYYYLDTSEFQVVGRGKARSPAMDHAPVASVLGITEPGQPTLVTMFSNSCGNGCDYCAFHNHYRYSSEQIRRGLEQAMERYGAGRMERSTEIVVWDANPLSEKAREHTRVNLEMIRDRIDMRLPASMCCDSSEFRDPEVVLELIQQLDIDHLMVGRDAVCEPGLSFMGTRFLGKRKTVDQLHEEKRGMEAVIRRLGELDRKMILDLYYLITPADDASSLEQLFEDMAQFHALSGGRVQVNECWPLLFPSPGTRCINKYTDLVSECVYDTPSHSAAWDEQATLARFPRSRFHDIVRALGKQYMTGGSYSREVQGELMRALK